MTNSKKNKKYVFKIMDDDEGEKEPDVATIADATIVAANEPDASTIATIDENIVDKVSTIAVEQKETLPIKENPCNKDCSKEPIKTKCNPKTKRCVAPKKSITKTKKVKFIIESDTL